MYINTQERLSMNTQTPPILCLKNIGKNLWKYKIFTGDKYYLLSRRGTCHSRGKNGGG